MSALTSHIIRKAALDVQAHNPLANVHVPEEPEWSDVIDAKTDALMTDCADKGTAEFYAIGHEFCYADPGAILHRIAEAYAASRSRNWDQEGRKNEMAAMGEDITRMAVQWMHGVAKYEMERERDV